VISRRVAGELNDSFSRVTHGVATCLKIPEACLSGLVPAFGSYTAQIRQARKKKVSIRYQTMLKEQSEVFQIKFSVSEAPSFKHTGLRQSFEL
jgi:hypothetical protein